MTAGRWVQVVGIKSVARLRMPALARWITPHFWWPDRQGEPHLYLTFDDGPIPEVTPWVLETLQTYQAQATFFCVGENVERHRVIFERLLEEGHRVGHHTEHHLNGWKTTPETYFANADLAAEKVGTTLFRPPYGRITPHQAAVLSRKYRIVLWDLVTGDYNAELDPQDIIQTVLKKTKSGDILVFHDSVKAWPNLRVVLPAILENFSKRGFQFRSIPS